MAHHSRMRYKQLTRDCMQRWRLLEGWDLLIQEAEEQSGFDDPDYSGGVTYGKQWKSADDCDSDDAEYRFAQMVESLENVDEYFWKNVAKENNYLGEDSVCRDSQRMTNLEDETRRSFFSQTFYTETGAMLWISRRLGDYAGGVCRWGEGDYGFIGLDKQRFWNGKYRYHVLMIADTILY